MGFDKAFLELGGRPILTRLLEEATVGFRDIVLVSNDLTPYAETLTRLGWSALPDVGASAFRKGPREVRLLSDRRPGLGPLAGLEVGLRAARNPHCWLLGCDLPFVVGEVGLLLLRKLTGPASPSAEADEPPGVSGSPGAIVPVVNDRLQTLCSALRSDSCRIAADCLDHGRHRMTDLLERIGYQTLDSSEFTGLGAPERLFFNLNSPDDLERARTWLE